jgi:NAD(P)-dependent dehydrogenase (short-subunit alcohol dehydrogenase family)
VSARRGVVTGGARGIGLAISRRLLADGVVDELVVLERDPIDIEGARMVACDVTDETSLARAVAELADAPVDVLVNNVGGGRFEDHADAFPDPRAWREMLELNVTSAFLVTRALHASLPRGAAICNISSGAGLVSNPPSLLAYGVAKAALLHWTRNLASLLAERGVRVNAVAPGFVWTDLVERLLSGDRSAFAAMAAENTALGEPQTGDDIACAVSFLCDPARAGQVTGHVVPVDGGATLSRKAPAQR